MQNGCAAEPHDNRERKPADSEHGVVHGDLLSTFMSATAVGDHDDDGEEERDAGDRKDHNLRPLRGVRCPRWEVIPWGEGLGCMEDGEGGAEHGENDERAREVDASKNHLGHPYSRFDFLVAVLETLLGKMD